MLKVKRSELTLIISDVSYSSSESGALEADRQVAELVGTGELVGMVRGCMKRVYTGSGSTQVMLCSILGLRVSPKHRRIGIGWKLVKSIEDWAARNGAQYIQLAVEKNNVASTNLFTLKCNYEKLSSLTIVVQPIDFHVKKPLQDMKVEKLSTSQAIALYKDRFNGKKFFPVDVDSLLREELNLGTWVSFFDCEEWAGLGHEETEQFVGKTPSSWAMLSIWKTYESYKIQIGKARLVRHFYTTITNVGAKFFPCFETPLLGEVPKRPFGHAFLYGLHGEGEQQGELMRSLWFFACNLMRKVKDCKVIITELATCDPVLQHIPQGTASLSFVDDLWCLKRVIQCNEGEDDWTKDNALAHLFVDPREF